MLPRALFTHRPYLLVVLSGSFYQVASYGSLLVLALYLQLKEGYSADVAGYAMLPCCVAWPGGNVLAVRVPRRRAAGSSPRRRSSVRRAARWSR